MKFRLQIFKGYTLGRNQKMKRSSLVLILVASIAMGGPAFAELCTVDAVPAATLLLPYFQVDLDDPAGVNTVFSINNASAPPALAHVTVWTDWSQPVLDFDVFLTGYDVQTVNLYDVFTNGNLPVTADEQSDPLDTISPHDIHPEWDGSFPQTAANASVDCLNIFPLFVNPVLQGTRLATIQDKLTGTAIGGACFGATHADGNARGYITVDSVDTCSLIFPNDDDYFTDGVNPAIANNNNVLWGDYFIVNQNNDSANGDNLVHIEATDAPMWDTGYTFYGRYSGPALTIDGREPLGTAWGVRYFQGGAFSGGTNLSVWRDSTVTDIDDAGYVCAAPGDAAGGPEWHPLNETEVIAFDEEEAWEELCGSVFGGSGPPVSPPDVPVGEDPTCFPLETQSVLVGDGALAPTFSAGWLFLNLNVGIDGPFVNFDLDPGSDGALAQSYVSATHTALGRFSVGLAGIELESACDDVELFVNYHTP